jgi:hypothetical protein
MQPGGAGPLREAEWTLSCQLRFGSQIAINDEFHPAQALRALLACSLGTEYGKRQ